MIAPDDIWQPGSQLITAVQNRDRLTSQRYLDQIVTLIDPRQSEGISHFKFRILQVLTNANRAAFNAGASTEKLMAHSLHIVGAINDIATRESLIDLARTALDETIALVPGNDAHQNRLARDATTFIRDHCTEPISREQLAERFRCSPAHFSRLFTRATGHPYRDFLLQCRLERAKDLLQNSRLGVAEIAQAVGYDDPFQFSKLFRRRVGVSPRTFRCACFEQDRPSRPALAASHPR
jgi:AraC-like DNA-binding protein